MRSRRTRVYGITALMGILVVSFFAIYFRTYAIHGGPFLHFGSPREIAKRVVENRIKDQLSKTPKREITEASEREREKKLAELAEQAIRKDPVQYNAAIETVAQSLSKGVPWSWRLKYLSEADPYHYLYQTEQVLETGQSGARRSWKVLSPLGMAPVGFWEPFLLHPYVGAFYYKCLSRFFPDITVVEAVAYGSLFLVFLIPFVFWLFSRAIGLGLLASIFGMTTLALSPIFIQRTTLGWYDTDPYNHLFPLAILSLVLMAMRQGKNILLYALSAACLTGLYVLFWHGWLFIFVLTSGGLLVSAGIMTLLGKMKPPPVVRTAFRFLGGYGSGTMVFLALFITPAGMVDSIRMAWGAFQDFMFLKFDLWPSILPTLGEIMPTSVNGLIHKTGNYVTFSFAILGIALETRRVLLSKEPYGLFRILFFVLVGMPLFLMTLQSVRFAVLLALPLSVFVGFAAENLSRLLGPWPWNSPAPDFLAKCRKPAAILLMSLIFFTPILGAAHNSARESRLIMDDVWFRAFQQLRTRTPEDAIVNSSWSPGYFISAIGRRRVPVDGGTQNTHVMYWLARAFFTDDEDLSAGILRMLDTRRDNAAEFLERSGMKTADAVELILKIVRLGRKEAFSALPSSMTAQQKNAFLDRTHGKEALPPMYVSLDSDLIEKNVALTRFARWDFRKAEAWRTRQKTGLEAVWGRLGNKTPPSYLQVFLDITGKFLDYRPALPLVSQEGDELTFGADPCVKVNWAIKDTLIAEPSKKRITRPVSLFYLDQGQLVEKIYADPLTDLSVLLFQDGKSLYAVMADAKLIRSMLFRLYYLQAEGLSFFKPFISEGSLSGGTCVRIFELDRSRFPE
ncbi:MAG: STT3 domain-containing protein [Candidatus Omnitrophota bacterium]